MDYTSIYLKDDNDNKLFPYTSENEVLMSNDKTLKETLKLKLDDVQIDGESIAVDGIANIPMATDSIMGVAKFRDSLGLVPADGGFVAIAQASVDDISNRESAYKPVVPTNLDYAVKTAMCDGKGTEWTDAEKASARARIGVSEGGTVDEVARAGVEEVRQGLSELDTEVQNHETRIKSLEQKGDITTFVFEDLSSDAFNIDDVEVVIQSTQYQENYGRYLFSTSSNFWWCNNNNTTITFSNKVKLTNISWLINTARTDRRTEIIGYVSTDGVEYTQLNTIQLGNSYDFNSNVKVIKFEGIGSWSGYNNLKLTVETLAPSPVTKEYVDEQNHLQDVEIGEIRESLVDKQDKIIAGTPNVTIGEDGRTLYVTDGGGSTVSVEQIQTSGTEIAKVTIDGDATSIYAPTSGGSTVSINPIQTTGTEIAQLTIDGETTSLYSPAGGEGGSSVTINDNSSGGVDLVVDSVEKNIALHSQVFNGYTGDINYENNKNTDYRGYIKDSSSHLVSDFISVTPGISFTWYYGPNMLDPSWTYANYILTYDQNKQWLTSISCQYTESQLVTLSNDVYYIRVPFKQSNISDGFNKIVDTFDTTLYTAGATQHKGIDMLSNELALKQDKLIAGTNITIDAATNTISATGGSGGSTVSIEQIQTTGTEIAKLSIDGNITSLYAPQGGSGEFDYPNAISTTEISDFTTEGKTVLAAINELNSKINSIVDGNEVEW